MAHDSMISPVGWYVVSYLLRFIEIGDPRNDDPERRFLVWVNTVIVAASRPQEAYEKAAKIARAAAKPYRGGPKGVRVRWVFEGVTEVLPIYEELGDGAEIMWENRGMRKLSTLLRSVKPKSAFRGGRKHHAA